MAQLTPGFLLIHGNRQEQLRELLVDWMRRYPLHPLEKETILVQSNGVAQWLQLALADDSGCGISAALQLNLPGRFLWQAYRAVLGDKLPTSTVFDKPSLSWRIYDLLPGCKGEIYQPLEQYLKDDQQSRKRYQLALRLADLFDQYQVYRADWLLDWENNQDNFTCKNTQQPLPDNQRWQAQLWRDLCAALPDDQRWLSRPHVHKQFLQAAELLSENTRPAALPRRIIVFGLSSLPRQAVEVLQALSRCCQIFLTVHNPSQYFWADILDNREQLRQRQQRRNQVGAQHGHPLLAAWGKQGRDYTGLLNEAEQNTVSPLVHQQSLDVFSEAEGESLLAQLQNDILHLRDNAECSESPRFLAADDQSCVFHICHSAQREVEVLHDQLLQAFADDPSLKPRDIIVMAPDINLYAPHIQAVFGQIEKTDARYLPFVISDQGVRQNNPLLLALEYLFGLPEARCTSSDILDLLAVPALRRRFAIDEEQLPLLQRWVQESGIRWGLDAEHREELALPALQQNSWQFGIERILLGYAAGSSEPWQGIEPYDEVAGLDAVLAGKLIQLIKVLSDSRRQLMQHYTAMQWQQQIQLLLTQCFDMQAAQEQRLLLQLQQALENWVADCTLAQCDALLPVNIVASHLLAAVDEHHLSQRFFAGSINFASLMPMRAIPFRKVCLLGMSDSAYPRRQTYNDFDLMRNDYRAGDRSRREDDRYLFLEALLSARQQLYISWTGRSVHDNSERAASVLVSQLRDHIGSLWALPEHSALNDKQKQKEQLLKKVTREYPLQPFSTQYFSDAGQAAGFFTYAREWQSLHDNVLEAAATQTPLAAPRREEPFTVRQWRALLDNPCAFFFNERLQVWLDKPSEEEHNHETFALDHLSQWQLQNQLLNTLRWQIDAEPASVDIACVLQQSTQKMQREGMLGMAGFAQLQQQAISGDLLDVAQQYQQIIMQCQPEKARAVQFRYASSIVFNDVVLQDVIGSLYRKPNGQYLHIVLTHSTLVEKNSAPRYKHFLYSWLYRALLTQAGIRASCLLISPSASVVLPPLTDNEAAEQLHAIATLAEHALTEPLPVTLDIMMQTLNGKTDWHALFDPLDQSANSRYLRRAFISAEAITRHPSFEQYLSLYEIFKQQIDAAVEAQQHD